MPRSPRLRAAASPVLGDADMKIDSVASSPAVCRHDVANSSVKPLKKKKKVRKALATEASTVVSEGVTESPPELQPRKKMKRKKTRAAAVPEPPTKVLEIAPSLPETSLTTKKVKRKKIKKAKEASPQEAPSMQAVKAPAVDFLSKKGWQSSVKHAQDQLKESTEAHAASKKKQAVVVAKDLPVVSKKNEACDKAAVNKASIFAEMRELRSLEKKPVAEMMDTNGVKRKAVAESDDAQGDSKKARGKDGIAVTKVLGAAAFRQEHNIVVSGTCPEPSETFEAHAADFGEPLIAALRLQGYTSPTPIQAQSWPIALRGQDMVGVAKTGSGKTCGFLLPAMARLRQTKLAPEPKRGDPAHPKVLVLAPTRELAQQIAGEAEKFAHVSNLKVVAVYGGVPKGDQCRALERGADIVIATPGRLLDFMAGKPEKNQGPLVSMKNVAYLVLDEADRMLDMGFEPEIRKIVAECPKSGRPEDHISPGLDASVRQTLFFTATWPKSVQQTAASLTNGAAVQIRIGQGAGGDQLTANTSVTQTAWLIDEKQKLTKLKEILEKELAAGETAFVFAKTRHTCDYLEKQIWDEKEDLSIGTWCRAIHSHREQWERDASLNMFRNITLGKDNGRKGILIATDVAARGLDIPGVALVVVYDFGGGNLGENSGVESYVHRIGRTGRAGKVGRAFTFFTEQDTGARKFVKLLDEAKQRVPYELRAFAEKSKGGGKGGKGKGGKSHGGKGKSKGGKGGKGKGW